MGYTFDRRFFELIVQYLGGPGAKLSSTGIGFIIASLARAGKEREREKGIVEV